MALSLPQALHLWLETSGKLRTVEGREKLTCDLNASKEQSNAIAVIAALIAASALMVSSRFSGYNDGDLAQHFHALNFLLGVTCVYISTIVSLPSHRDAHPKPNVTPTPSPTTPMPALANPFPNITSNSFLFTHDDKIRHQSSTGMLDQGGVD
eukprot:CAMPEP_0181184024 /NCGR_PEP_ID=MMETSP1096-20121128/8744_1 /TAXON_ID=156174 ORGANISM="Chrysochromulina ericina, Strain CCMP281" /NCGR_SAMPLE_ID=MMETSP1096 /ASSEMBLY_ACC=CAM_ASM_000453 /LENGTH=152 /DNA_ID=CAMNT_0023272755 /DNA_START=371 /DNA_END=830 /DNA_ORIENTATION=-